MIKKLSEAVGVSGNESNVRNIIAEFIDKLGLKRKTDSIGNLIVSSNHIDNRPTIILSAHMDEPGIIVTDITDDGYLKFDIIGNIDMPSLVSQHIKIGETEGIISLKAVHLTTKEERQKKVKVSDLYIDIGAADKKDAETVIVPGDYGAFDTKFDIMNDYIKGKSLSSRAGCVVLLETLAKSNEYNVNIIAVFSVQKEVHGRGINVAAHSLPDADCLLLLDAEDSTPDSSFAKDKKQGIGIGRYTSGSIKTNELLSVIESIASETDIIFHRSVVNKSNELRQIISNKNNLPIIPINIPCQFINSSINVMNKKDITDSIALIDSIIRRIEDGEL